MKETQKEGAGRLWACGRWKHWEGCCRKARGGCVRMRTRLEGTMHSAWQSILAANTSPIRSCARHALNTARGISVCARGQIGKAIARLEADRRLEGQLRGRVSPWPTRRAGEAAAAAARGGRSRRSETRGGARSRPLSALHRRCRRAAGRRLRRGRSGASLAARRRVKRRLPRASPRARRRRRRAGHAMHRASAAARGEARGEARRRRARRRRRRRRPRRRFR